jgi:hypothetical protein
MAKSSADGSSNTRIAVPILCSVSSRSDPAVAGATVNASWSVSFSGLRLDRANVGLGDNRIAADQLAPACAALHDQCGKRPHSNARRDGTEMTVAPRRPTADRMKEVNFDRAGSVLFCNAAGTWTVPRPQRTDPLRQPRHHVSVPHFWMQATRWRMSQTNRRTTTDTARCRARPHNDFHTFPV